MENMKKINISRKVVEGLPVSGREAVYWDRELSGFGVRVYPTGSRMYLVQTRAKGKSRRITIGRHGLVSADRARTEAARIIATIKAGGDPVVFRHGNGTLQEDMGPTITEVAERFMREHVQVRCGSATEVKYRHLLGRHILPALGSLRLGEIGREQVASLQYRLHETPHAANQAVTLLSHLYRTAEGWSITTEGGNPCRFVRKYPEPGRERFLSEEEFRNLGRALDELGEEGKLSPSAVAAFHLLMLTGCRRNEILMLRWEDVDLEVGEIRLRDAKTGPRPVALSPSAMSILKSLRGDARPDNPWVIASRRGTTRLAGLSRYWGPVRERAGLKDVRIHDLRHSFASRALALGEGLPMIGRLLGHRKMQTTARYAHLAQESVKEAAERVAESLRADLAGGPG